MSITLTHSTGIFDAFISISSFSMGEMFWEKYQKHTIPKIKQSIMTIKGARSMVKDLTPKQAKKELAALDKIKPAVLKVWKDVEKINQNDFTHFKNETIAFFEELNLLYTALQDIAFPESYNKLIDKTFEKEAESEIVDWNEYL